jgi:pimeloyl-ACP methyl ester carboxylesterase
LTIARKNVQLGNGYISFLEKPGTIPLVFLHGIGGLGNNWMKLTGRINGNFRMILPDLPGHGRTTLNLNQWTIAEQVDALRSFFQVEGIHRPVLVGNSYGGWIALSYCLRFRDLSSMVLIDSAGINTTIGESGEEKTRQFLNKVMQEYPGNREDIIRKVLEMNSRNSEKISLDELRQINCPTLIIWGYRDTVIPLNYGESLWENIPGSQLYLIGGGGHIPHYTHAEEVGKLIGDFLAVTQNGFRE